MAALSSNQDDTWPGPTIFDWVLTNPGDNYDSSTGIYTAPCDGVYQFSVHITSSGSVNIEMFLNGSQQGTHKDNYRVGYYRATTLLQPIAAGDTFYVSHGNVYALGSATYLYSYFSGYLVRAN